MEDFEADNVESSYTGDPDDPGETPEESIHENQAQEEDVEAAVLIDAAGEYICIDCGAWTAPGTPCPECGSEKIVRR